MSLNKSMRLLKLSTRLNDTVISTMSKLLGYPKFIPASQKQKCPNFVLGYFVQRERKFPYKISISPIVLHLEAPLQAPSRLFASFRVDLLLHTCHACAVGFRPRGLFVYLVAHNTYGKLSEFDLNSTGQGWTEYCEQMEYYFSTNAIKDGKQKKAILLASVGNGTFKLIRNPFGQKDLKTETTTLENICKRVKDHLSPKPNYIFARSDFVDCARKPGQSIADFLVDLRKLS